MIEKIQQGKSFSDPAAAEHPNRFRPIQMEDSHQISSIHYQPTAVKEHTSEEKRLIQEFLKNKQKPHYSPVYDNHKAPEEGDNEFEYRDDADDENQRPVVRPGIPFALGAPPPSPTGHHLPYYNPKRLHPGKLFHSGV